MSTEEVLQSTPPPKWQETARGKGRVRPRKGAAESTESSVPRLAAVAHSDAEHGELESDPRPRYGEELATEWVPYLRMDTPQAVYAALNTLWSAQPVLLRGTPLVAGLAGRWSFAHLAKLMGPEPKLPVLCSDAKRHRFIEYDSAKNVHGCFYHVREPETQRLEPMAFADFAACAASWRARRLLAKAVLLRHDPGARAEWQQRQADAPAGAPPPQAPPPAPDPWACGSGLAAQLADGVDWAWLQGLRASQRWGPLLDVTLEAATTDALLPARYAPHDRLLAQAAGRRRVLLLPPDQAFEGLYPYPVHHTYDGYSMVDLEAVDLGLWPKAARLRGRLAVLAPGDLLFVPAYWFVHEQQLEGEGLGLSFRLAQGGRPPARDATPLRLSRMVEERVAELEGLADVRHWVQLIGHGEEHEWIDLATVRGYKRIVACQAIRDDVEAALGPGSWASLLPAMAQGRLVPTPWLNKDFREPLYLLDKPVWLEDDRSEEERRYPELFRAKLEAAGWRVAPSVSTVPIPGYNMPLTQDYRTL